MYLCSTNFRIHTMLKNTHLIILFAFISIGLLSKAQSGSLKPAPFGVFILLNTDIPTGKRIASYSIERSSANGSFEKIGEAKTPATFEEFVSAINKSKLVFPSQPIPSENKLREIYNQVNRTPHLDSLRKTRLILPIRLALGVMYYDSTAKPDITYKYAYTPMLTNGDPEKKVITDTVRLPYQVRFDTIRYAASSFNDNSITITWQSAGKNPAPLFMIYKFRNYSPVPAPGQTSRYSVNDTTYYVFKDSITTSAVTKDIQYFVSPYDQYSNSGISSQVAIITNDNFFRGNFLRQAISFEPLQSGVLLRWHHSDSPTVKHYTVYRSDAGKNGFVKIAEIPANDTSYLDQKIWPEKSYDYYLEATAKVGKRTKTGKVMSAWVPAISTSRVSLNAPIIKLCVLTPQGARLLIVPNDSLANAIRIFRGTEEAMITLPVTIDPLGQKVVEFIDNTYKPSESNTIVYAARNEKTGEGISPLSVQAAVENVFNPSEIAYFEVYKSGNRYDFYWDDIASRNTSIGWYAIYSKQNRPGEQFKILSDKLQKGTFSTHVAVSSYNQIFLLKAFDKNGKETINTLQREVER